MCRIPQLLLIRVSGANITLDYRVRSYLLLTTVSDTNTSLDQFVRYWNYCWSEFLVQTLLLIIGSDQNYSWPESPEQIFLFISMPEITPVQSFWCKHYSWSKVPPDQSFWCKHYSWLEGPIMFTPDNSLRYLYFSWSMSPIPKLLLIRVSGANITPDYRVLSKILLTRLSNTNISLYQCARYRNNSWPELLVLTLLLIIGSDRSKLLLTRVSDIYISLDQWARHQNYSWSEFLVQILLLIIGSDQIYSRPESSIQIYLLISLPDTEITPDQSFHANVSLDYRVWSKLLLTRICDTYISLDQRSRYRNYSWSEFLVQTLLLIIGYDQNYSWPESPKQIFLFISMHEITPDQSFWCKHYSWL